MFSILEPRLEKPVMSHRSLRIICFAIALFIAQSSTKSLHAQYSCGQGYGNPYGYQSQAYYGQPNWSSSYGGYSGSSYFGSNGYAPVQSAGFPIGIPAPVGIPQQSYYSNNFYSSNPGNHHSHHPWHPGHYLLGHY